MSYVALLRVLKQREETQGVEAAYRLENIDPKAWYPIGPLLDLMDKLDQQVGYFGLVRMGRTIFNLSHEAVVSQALHSARELLEGFDALYHRSNRGQLIGGWRVLRFDPGTAEIEKTTPHHCAMEQGILAAALQAVGCPAMVNQSACFREGAEACRFVITSSITDSRWSGKA